MLFQVEYPAVSEEPACLMTEETGEFLEVNLSES